MSRQIDVYSVMLALFLMGRSALNATDVWMSAPVIV